MRTRITAAVAAFTLLLALAGCTSPTGTATGESDAPTPQPTDGAMQSGDTTGADDTGDAGDASGPTVLVTADSALGTIVVDAAGMTVYVFDGDAPGTTTSACTGQCLASWPLVTTDSETPRAEGVTGTVGTIESPDGLRHVTLDGRPLYYFAGDGAPGDVTVRARAACGGCSHPTA